MLHTSETIVDAMELDVAFHTRKFQIHCAGEPRNIYNKTRFVVDRFLLGSSGLEELQQDMGGTVTII